MLALNKCIRSSNYPKKKEQKKNFKDFCIVLTGKHDVAIAFSWYLNSGFKLNYFLTYTDMISENNRRKIAGWTIMFTCVGAFVLSYSASSLGFPR